MVIRLGRNGRFLACSMYPEHKESRPLPGEEPPPQEGTGEVCPECGEGTLVSKRGRFGPFVGCSRYPDCKYIKKDGPPPPDPLPFTVECPKNKDGHLVPRRARRTGNVFWGCSNYPKCDFTTNLEPLGGTHDADGGPLARKGEAAICLVCGSTSEVAPDDVAPGEAYPGGPPDPTALERPKRAGRTGGARGGRRTDRTNGRGPTRGRRSTEPATGA
jgi:ssDNA-binding Zn-finger/Zn-ribbon topoisomerase 1